MRFFYSHTRMQKQSQNPLFKKKNLAKFPKQKPHLHQIWYHWVPDIHSRHQTVELLSLASQIAVWLQFLVICDLFGGAEKTPLASFYQFCIPASGIKINIFIHRDQLQVLPLFIHETFLYSCAKYCSRNNLIYKLSSKHLAKQG